MPQQFLGQRRDVTPSYLQAENQAASLDLQREKLNQMLEDNSWEKHMAERKFKNKLASDAYDREFGEIRLEKEIEQREFERGFKEEGQEIKREGQKIQREGQKRLYNQNEKMQIRMMLLDKTISDEAKNEWAQTDVGKEALKGIGYEGITDFSRQEKSLSALLFVSSVPLFLSPVLPP